jgi:hypothetical protein
MSLAKVTFDHSVKLCPYSLRGGVAVCLGVAYVLCAVQNVHSTQHNTTHNTQHTPLQDMLPDHHVTYKDTILPSVLT